MNSNTTNLRDIKKMRLERHWSQEQLAEMSGLNIRTIQRIENGENAGLESLKSLAAVFEINITDSDKTQEIEQIRKKEEYIQNLMGFYKFLERANLVSCGNYMVQVIPKANACICYKFCSHLSFRERWPIFRCVSSVMCVVVLIFGEEFSKNIW